MKMKIFKGIYLICLLLFSCKSNVQKSKDMSTTETVDTNKLADIVFDNDWQTISKDFKTWYNYTYYNVALSEDFIGLNAADEKVDKKTFLQKLVNENQVAYKTKIENGQSVYQLFNLSNNDKSIVDTKKQMASTALIQLAYEGTSFPNFNLSDLQGINYSTENTKGKILVVKCWFIHCVACVAEFPELNKLVDENKERNDVVFMSLAMDEKEPLIKFLKTKEFKYATIPNTTDFMVNKLKTTAYPTHFLVDKTGKIVKVVNKVAELIPFLKKELNKSSL